MLGLQRERRPVMDPDVCELRDGPVARRGEGLEPELIDQPCQHVPHERREPDPRQPVVERLLRDRDVVLIVEGVEHVGDLVDPSG